MNLTLYNDEKMLPNTLGPHILIYTGFDDTTDQENSDTVTEIHCAYTVGDQEVQFTKNTDSVHLRFEDAVLWAIGYAETFRISQIYAVFKLSRPIDTRFLQKIGSVPLIDERRRQVSNDPFGVWQPEPSHPPVSRPMRNPKIRLQRHSVLRGKLNRCREVRRHQSFRPLR
jgi:hypothetical protein